MSIDLIYKSKQNITSIITTGRRTCLLTQTCLLFISLQPSSSFCETFHDLFQVSFLKTLSSLQPCNTPNMACVEGRCKTFKVRWSMWNKHPSFAVNSCRVSECSLVVDNAILWFLWKSSLGRLKKLTVSVLSRVLFLPFIFLQIKLSSPKISPNKNGSQIINEAVGQSGLVKSGNVFCL